MTPGDAAALFDAVSKLTIGGLLAVVIVVIIRGTLITRKHHEDVLKVLAAQLVDVEEDRDFWRRHSFQLDDRLGRSVEVAAKVTEKALRP